MRKRQHKILGKSVAEAEGKLIMVMLAVDRVFGKISQEIVEEVVQELLQDDFTPDNMKNALLDIWPDTDNFPQTINELQAVCEKLGDPGASRNAARLALQTMNQEIS